MPKTIQTEATIQIEPAAGGVKLFVPIDPELFVQRRYLDLLLRTQQALVTYLTATAIDRLPVIV